MTQNARLEALETLRLRLCSDIARRVRNDAAAEQALDTQDARGSWPDAEFGNPNLKDWGAIPHLARMRLLAVAFADPASPRRGCRKTLGALLRALDCWYDANPKNPNWWWNEIGAPEYLGETLLFIKHDCDRSYIDRAIPSFECHRRPVRFTGQNLVWVSFVEVRQGILTDQPSLVSFALASIAAEIRVFPDHEGIQPDMSFHQHGRLLYNGGYGKSFAMDAGGLIAMAAGTPFALDPKAVKLVADFLLDGSRWMIRGRTFDPGVTGRELSRKGHDAGFFFLGLKLLAEASAPRADEIRASLAVDPGAGRSMVTGNRFFWSSDFLAHHRDGFACTVRMTSRRVLKADGPHCGGEGRVCHHMADGATFFYRDGDEYRDIFPVWNWRQIPGTTLAQKADPFDERTLVKFGETAFAGGASDGTRGCAGMIYERDGVAARKAWFTFDAGLVALGAGIASADEAPVRTTLNQCLRRGPVARIGEVPPLSDGPHLICAGEAFTHDGWTYRIIDGAATLVIGTQSGAWSDCGVGSPDPITLPIFNVGIDHGGKPADARYAYAVTSTRAGVEAGERIAVLANTPTLQAVWHAGERQGQAVFYEAGAVRFPDGQTVAVDRPAALLYSPSDSGVSLTAAQPEHLDGTLTITLTGRINSTLTLTLPTREYAGASQTVTLRPG